jgi:hypothetical protein
MPVSVRYRSIVPRTASTVGRGPPLRASASSPGHTGPLPVSRARFRRSPTCAIMPQISARAMSSKPTVGAQNCRVAEEVLAEEGFTVSASDVGGIRGRRIHFHAGTGEVLLHRLGAGSDPTSKRA